MEEEVKGSSAHSSEEEQVDSTTGPEGQVDGDGKNVSALLHNI